MVLNPFSVVTLSTTLNSVGEVSCTTVKVPSPFELNARFVSGTKAQKKIITKNVYCEKLTN